MKRIAFAIVIVLAGTLVQGQQASGTITVSGSILVSPWKPHTAHEYVLSVLQDVKDYKATHSDSSRSFFAGGTWYVGNIGPDLTSQNFAVDLDGHIHLENISLEDAFLSVWASRLSEEMLEWKRFDQEEQAKKDVPPTQFKAFGTRYTMLSLPDWSNGTALGDTTCGLQRVRVLETNTDKKATVMHELMHVATHCNADPKLHAAITALAPSLLKLLRENPDLVRYLLKPEVEP